MLAPWQILAAAGFLDWEAPIEMDGHTTMLLEQRRTRDAVLAISRVWRDTIETALSGVYTRDDVRRPEASGLVPSLDRHLGGPAVSLAWQSGESTPYTGWRRALLASASAAYYPRALSSFAGDIYDTRGELDTVWPLPVGSLHTLTLRLIGRAVVAGSETGLLEVGGASALSALVTGRSTAAEPPAFDDARFPPNLRFTEYLRGYEDYAITTDRVAIASLSWRYPLIIDRGVAATFGVLPASFLRQLDLELFAAGAVDRRRDAHAAAGGELALRFELLHAPLVLGYQVARRVRDDDAWTQLLELGVGL
jgi:hypothetical protein